MLIYWLWGVILIYRPCGAEFLAPGCYFDRPALWCWLVGSGMLFQSTVPVVLIWCLQDAILVDSYPPWYDFGRPALWCWFKGSGVLFWYTGPVVLTYLLRGAILIDWPCGADLLATGCKICLQSCPLIWFLLDRPCGADVLAPGHYFDRLALWYWFINWLCICSFDRPTLWRWFDVSGVVFQFTDSVVLMYWLQGAILIARPCCADFLAPGWYIDRPTLWCWFIGCVFALLIDRPCGADLLAPGCYFYWPALWCWFDVSGMLFW